MKKASHILYTIGKWLQLALVILAAIQALIMFIFSIVNFVDGEYGAGVALLLTCPLWLIIEVAAWIVVLIAIKKQKANSKDKAPHIMCIVAGVVAWNPCYIAGAILALIMISKGQEVEPIQAISKEQVQKAVKKDEKKEDVKDVDSKPVEEKKEEPKAEEKPEEKPVEEPKAEEKPEEKPAEAEEVEEAESAEEAKPAE